MKSMTGYGIECDKLKNCYIEVIVQSYNSKILDLQLKIPPFYSPLEGELRKILNSQFHRGVVNLFINRNPYWPPKKTLIQWNPTQALKWKTLFHKMALKLKLEPKIDLLKLAQQPGVLEVSSQVSEISVSEKTKIKNLIRKAIKKCDIERQREGASIKKDFQINLKKISACMTKISTIWKKQKNKTQKNVEKKINLTNMGNSKKTIHEVTGAIINRMDINEEIMRMKEHIQAVSKLILFKGILGKKLSFYLQEMIRESNTMGSKSQNFKLTQEIVHTKSLIERMREQVHNVE